MIARPSILFVCRDNAALSLMAEALTMHLHPRVRAFSAAIEAPMPVDPAALDCLRCAGIAADGLSAKPVELFALSGAPRVDVVVALMPDVYRATRRLAWLHLMHLDCWTFAEVARDVDPCRRRRAYAHLLPDLKAAIMSLVERETAPAAA